MSERSFRPTRRAVLLAALGASAGAALLAAVFVLTAPTRGVLRTYTALIAAANRGDLDAVRSLCTDRYLAAHPPRLAPEGGLVGLPRGIHKNFRTWRRGEAVCLCPTDRAGPLYRFLPGPDGWKFDGLAGYLRPDGGFVPADPS